MPRNRRDDNESSNLKTQDVEEDYLDVDKPLSGQNYYCISFVSPEKVLEQKDLFMFYHYERAVNKRISSLLDETLAKVIDASTDGTVDVSDIIKLKKTLTSTCKEYDVTMDGFKEQFENFKFQNEEKIGEEFDKVNKFRTSVRGVKVRGVFDSKREADIRASVLQRQDAIDTDDYYKPEAKPKQRQSGNGQVRSTSNMPGGMDDDKRYEKLMRELEGGRAEQMALLKQVQEMKQGITDAASKAHTSDVEIMRKKMLLRF